MDDPQDQLGAAYECLLAHCGPLTFPGPWSFLPPHPCCRGPVRDPEAALADLRKDLPDAALSFAGLLQPGPDGRGRLRPALARPAGAVVALRSRPEAPPFALLAAGCCLPVGRLALVAALEDGWTARAVWGRALFAAADVMEVALLRSLDLPATLAAGLAGLRAERLRMVHKLFGTRAGRRPVLALLGWSPLAPSAAPNPAIAPPAARLAAAQEYLDLPLDGVLAWEFHARELDNLRFRLELRDAGLVRELLLASAEFMGGFEWLATGRPPGEAARPPEPGYAAAQAGLLAALARRRELGWRPDGLRAAAAAYEAAVQRELVGPLQEWALAGDDPVARAAGAELANVAGLLHRMAPVLTDLQAAHLTWPRGAEAGPTPLLGQYLATVSRFGGLLRDLDQWRKA
jgi:hypothetical protein